MTRGFGYRRYGTPGQVTSAGPRDQAIVATEFGYVPVRHLRGAPFAVGDYVVIFEGGIADVVPRPARRSRARVPAWVRLAVALAAAFRS